MPPVPPRALDVASLIDGRPITGLQIRVFVLCALVAVLDGADSQSIGVAGPLIAADFKMSMGAFSPAFSAGLFGATIGALAFGPVGDRLGRKPLLVFTTALFGAFTCLTALADSFPLLVFYRFIAGLGLGGATPLFITMAAEYAPARRRAMLASLLWAGYPLGNAVGGFMTAFVVTHFRWPMVFYAGGVPTLAVALLLFLFMPESLRFLAGRGPSAQAEALARRLDPGLGLAPFVLTAQRPGRTEKVRLRALFAQGRAAGTILLWLILFLAFATTTIIVLMSPTLLRASGIALSQTGILVGIFSIAAVCGMAVAGKLVEFAGPAAALAPAFFVGAGLLAGLGQFAGSPIAAGVFMVLLGLTVPLGASGTIALAATFYPTAIRSTGLGWVMAWGRFGQVCSPLATGLMLVRGFPASHILMVLAAAPFLAGLAVLARSVLSRGGLAVTPLHPMKEPVP
jgi:AAHS family 4-hydroxybenzoate transporter-like MFS transporter